MLLSGKSAVDGDFNRSFTAFSQATSAMPELREFRDGRSVSGAFDVVTGVEVAAEVDDDTGLERSSESPPCSAIDPTIPAAATARTEAAMTLLRRLFGDG
ncbi:hypothetical protein A6I86_23325 [Prescottella equi]|nr:hypothetical protein A6I86_23325 [Prescottella equi]